MEKCKYHDGKGDCLSSYRRWEKCKAGTCPATRRHRTTARKLPKYVTILVKGGEMTEVTVKEDGVEVSIKVEATTLADLLPIIEQALRGCGYLFDGKLDFVDRD